MLQKVQLLVACCISKVVAGCTFSTFLCTKRGICKYNIIAGHCFSAFAQCIAKHNFSFNVMKHCIHQGKAVCFVNKLTTCKCFLYLELRFFFVQVAVIIRPAFYILVSTNHKAEGATSRVITTLAGFWGCQTCHNINQNTWSKILTGSAFLFVSVLFQKPFIKISKPFFFCRIPVQFINRFYDFFKILRFIDIRTCALIDFPYTTFTVFTKIVQKFLVEFFKFNSAMAGKFVPSIFCRNRIFGFSLLCHFQKENISEFSNILMIGNSVIAQNITKIPKFRNNFLISHFFSSNYLLCNIIFVKICI